MFQQRDLRPQRSDPMDAKFLCSGNIAEVIWTKYAKNTEICCRGEDPTPGPNFHGHLQTWHSSGFFDQLTFPAQYRLLKKSKTE